MKENALVSDLLALWAKSNADGASHSLPAHLLDTAAVAELVWDEFMAPHTRDAIDAVAGGRGRELYVLICGLHDAGKATPAFQLQDEKLAAQARERGIPLPSSGLSLAEKRWHHTHAGREIVAEFLAQETLLDWVPAIIDGHHGRFRSMRLMRRAHGSRAKWGPLQQGLCRWVADECRIDVAGLGVARPPLGLQLAITGFVVMADWIASSLPGTGLEPPTLLAARSRARSVWEQLGLSAAGFAPGSDAGFAERFGFRPRPLQQLIADACRTVPRPGLIIVEAPMGEGKTEAALAGAEILAGRFGLNGFAFAMPTQGTTDAMYRRCAEWAESVNPHFPVSLVHGKAMANEAWRERVEGLWPGDICGEGDDDPYGAPTVVPVAGSAPVEWLRGRHRALLSPGVVPTVDHLLYAATRTKWVALRHAGLVGKVVVIDEVHSYDIYMSQFLTDLLTWLAQTETPVILMSATLPPAVRGQLLSAYAGRTVGEVGPASTDYPRVSSVVHGASEVQTWGCEGWRASQNVEVEFLSDASDDTQPLVSRIEAELADDGGCVLAILNTVSRAQQVYQGLRTAGVPAILIHGRLTTEQRATRTAEAIEVLGRDRHRGAGRPHTLVVVATQIAEQSFDADADLLVTDFAPMDLMLQRVGRVHRHERPVTDRPVGLRSSRMVVTGLALNDRGWELVPAFAHVYDEWVLLCTALALRGVATISVPEEVPSLVRNAYAEPTDVPGPWLAVAAAARASSEKAARARTARAKEYLLSQGVSPNQTDLTDLTSLAASNSGGEEAIVRDSDPTTEVCLVVKDEHGFATLDGTRLGPDAERSTELRIARKILGDSVRLRDRDLKGAKAQPLSRWADVPLLRWMPALVLDATRSCSEETIHLSYDEELGLVIERHWAGAR